ncbi:E3 ubiquitin-protein ligase Praja-2 [Glycine max]|nr:E3 ubiquitin-protein ligase Praja-2 [Glycine max]
MEPLHCIYSVSMLSGQHTTLMPDYTFKFIIEVSSYLSTDQMHTLCYSPAQSIPCQNFFNKDQELLWTQLRMLLWPIYSFVESFEQLIEGLISAVQSVFRIDVLDFLPPGSHHHQDVPLKLEIILLDDNMLTALTMEVSMHDYKMIPASSEAIQTLLKKSTVQTQDECCSICLEGLDINVYTMPCNHMFHHQCIVTWLQNSHMCPLCRYPLPLQKL